jgi:hypothetical protein
MWNFKIHKVRITACPLSIARKTSLNNKALNIIGIITRSKLMTVIIISAKARVKEKVKEVVLSLKYGVLLAQRCAGQK